MYDQALIEYTSISKSDEPVSIVPKKEELTELNNSDLDVIDHEKNDSSKNTNSFLERIKGR